MSSTQASSIVALKHRTKRPFRLTTPSTLSKSSSHYVSVDSPTSSSSPSPSRSPSARSGSATSSTSDSSSSPFTAGEQAPIVDDTDALTEQQVPDSMTEAIRLSKDPEYFPPDHFLAPPTPEQLRRRKKRKPRKLLWTFVRQKAKEPRKKEIFIDEQVKQRVEADKSKWQKMSSVTVSVSPPEREKYAMNSAEFIPVKVLRRVYKPTTLRRRRNYHDIEEGIGIGGYVIRFLDGHEHCVLLLVWPR